MNRSIRIAFVLLIVIALLTLIFALGVRAIVKRVRSFLEVIPGLVSSGPQEQAT